MTQLVYRLHKATLGQRLLLLRLLFFFSASGVIGYFFVCETITIEHTARQASRQCATADNHTQPGKPTDRHHHHYRHHHHHHHHHHYHHHLIYPLTAGGRGGTTDDFTTSFPQFFPVLRCPLGLGELQACPFPDVVFQRLSPSTLSSSPFTVLC